MQTVYIYDLIFLVLFCLGVFLFLYKNRKRVKIESKIFLMYRTKVGLKFMNWASKFSKLWNVLSYLSITFGFLAMIGIFALFIISIKMMVSLVSVPKIPPLLPLVPYLPQMFDLPLPPFYFTYWILIILVVAVTHEFAHGVFARHFKIRVKATGFGFLGPFLAAFVEPDEKAMKKKSKKAQLSILGAGSFSNFIFAIIFLLVLQLFLVGCYEKVGVIGYTYVFDKINVSDIEKIDGYNFEEFLNLSNEELQNMTELIPVDVNNKTYYLKSELFIFLEQVKQGKTDIIILYQNAPAIKANLSGAIVEIEGNKIEKIEDVYQALSIHKANETIQIKTIEKSYYIRLDEHPTNSSKGYLGIGFPVLSGTTSFLSKMISPFYSVNSYLSPKYNPELLKYIKDFLFWLILICFSVALINMLPLGILDGGRFIYITALGITKSKKKAEIVFKMASFAVLLIFLILMLVWINKAFLI